MKLTNNELQYIEFASRDLSAIQGFYEAAFGWKFTSYGDGAYLGFEGTYVDGGFYEGDVVKGSIVPILYADDLPTAITAVTEAGGTITQDIFPFPGGQRFHFTDPDGNELAVWSK